MYYTDALVEVYVADTSVVIEGILSKLVREGRLRGKIIIHRATLVELERQANAGKAIGFAGLEEIKRLRELAKKGMIDIEIAGEIRHSDLRSMSSEFVDAIIREYAYEVGGTLVTSDRVQALVAEAMGVSVIYVQPRREEEKLEIERLFDDKTMSIHLREGLPPRAKKGEPGKWVLVNIENSTMQRQELERIAREIVEAAKRRSDGFVEIDRVGSTIVQLGRYRIVITRPPLSDAWEITIVRPLKKLRLQDYNLPSKVIKRLEERAEGILIAGAPGMGKTTFAQALAEYYAGKGKIVKTIESPRDMILPPTITQYSKTYADMGELHDILLLSRPDYTVFDELRTDEDFRLYVDLRLAGIGMIGVVHATSPIDAIQRFLNRVDLGMLPSIIDTVIFIHEGKVAGVYELRMTVKLPTGLREADLARPVVEVRDYITDELLYEIYTFGEQKIVVPVKSLRSYSGVEEKLRKLIEKLIPGAEVEIKDNIVVVNVPRVMAKILQKRMKRLRKLEDKYGIPIRINMVG